MKYFRRTLGLIVMVAGILGLVLSLAGLVSVWVIKPSLTEAISSTLDTLITSIDTSQAAMEIASDTLTAAVGSIDALSEMLANIATTVEETKPIVSQLNTIIGDTLPFSLETASQSLVTAQKAADALDTAIKSFDNFRIMLSATPFLGSMIEPGEPYNPDVPLSESLGELVSTLQDLPDTFSQMSDDIDNADNNLETIQTGLSTMSESVGQISQSLEDYKSIITQSKSSLEDLKGLLTNFQLNLKKILNGLAIVASLFFFWLLITQVVILSQGWELFQGTAGGMESGKIKSAQPEIESIHPGTNEISPVDSETAKTETNETTTNSSEVIH